MRKIKDYITKENKFWEKLGLAGEILERLKDDADIADITKYLKTPENDHEIWDKIILAIQVILEIEVKKNPDEVEPDTIQQTPPDTTTQSSDTSEPVVVGGNSDEKTEGENTSESAVVADAVEEKPIQTTEIPKAEEEVKKSQSSENTESKIDKKVNRMIEKITKFLEKNKNIKNIFAQSVFNNWDDENKKSLVEYLLRNQAKLGLEIYVESKGQIMTIGGKKGFALFVNKVKERKAKKENTDLENTKISLQDVIQHLNIRKVEPKVENEVENVEAEPENIPETETEKAAELENVNPPEKTREEIETEKIENAKTQILEILDQQIGGKTIQQKILEMDNLNNEDKKMKKSEKETGTHYTAVAFFFADNPGMLNRLESLQNFAKNKHFTKDNDFDNVSDYLNMVLQGFKKIKTYFEDEENRKVAEIRQDYTNPLQPQQPTQVVGNSAEGGSVDFEEIEANECRF